MAQVRSGARLVLLSGALLFGLAAPGCGDERATSGPIASRPEATATTPMPTVVPTVAALPDGIDATVLSVTDGDTVRVRTTAGANEPVRLIGIDTPETRDPRRPVECFGREAAAQTATLLSPGTRVRLELDVEVRDRYGRLLAYVWRLDDALFVNARLVEGGWAVPYRYPPNVRYADLFSRLGSKAREAGRGLWSACRGA